MKRRRGPRPHTRLAALMALLLASGGCAVKPVAPHKVEAAQLEQRPPAPLPVYSDMDHTLYCLGDKLREQNIQPVLIGYSAVADTSGKTGVDFAAVLRSALSKVASRGNNLAITAMGFGPSAKPDQPSVEERELGRDRAREARLVRPDWLITGGSVSVSSAFMSVQNSAGLAGRDIDLAASGTANVDLISLSFGLKSPETGVDLPMRTVDVRVSHQVLSSSSEIGVFAQARVDGRRYGAGLRLGRTVAITQLAEDAARVGIEWSAAQLLAGLYGVDLAACPGLPLTPDDQLPKAERLPAMAELPKIWRGWSPAQRLQWFQAILAARGYAPGPADGKPSAATREALTRAAQDHGLPPTGQASDTLFYVLAARELAYRRDPRKPPPQEAAPTPPRVHVQLQQPNAPYVVGVNLRATVVPPQAGHLHCWLVTPEGTLPLHPVLKSRSPFVTAGSTVHLPDPQASGPHPRVRLTAAGAHELWCGLARRALGERLPAELRAGTSGSSKAAGAELRDLFARAAGADWLADGSAPFTVVAATTGR